MPYGEDCYIFLPDCCPTLNLLAEAADRQYTVGSGCIRWHRLRACRGVVLCKPIDGLLNACTDGGEFEVGQELHQLAIVGRLFVLPVGLCRVKIYNRVKDDSRSDNLRVGMNGRRSILGYA